MKKTGFLLALPLLLAAFAFSFSKNPPVNVSGMWKLNAYGYNSGGRMDMYFVDSIFYEFKSDSTGRLIKAKDTTDFRWVLNKNMMTLTVNSQVNKYRVFPENYGTELLLVDMNAGVDERRAYFKKEKTLILKRY